MALSLLEKTLRLVQITGILRPRDLDKHGIPRQYLYLLKRDGKVQSTGRGLYVASEADVTENHTIAEACKRVPHGVVCLLSALRLHALTTQLPHQVWLAIERKARKPSALSPPLRIVRFSGDALTSEIEVRKIEGVPVRVYGPAKTVADCFKYRHKIGVDVAIEALRDCRRKRKATMDQLWAAAKICRVSRVMQPYMESVA